MTDRSELVVPLYPDYMTDTLPLARHFPTADREQWRALAAAALARTRGNVAPEQVEQLLATQTDDGFAVLPLYTATDGVDAGEPSAPGTGDRMRGTRSPDAATWSIRQRHWVGGGPEQGLPAAQQAIADGAESLWLTVLAVDALPQLLAGLDLTSTPVVLEAFADAAAAAEQLLAALPESGAPATTSLGLDPVGWAAATGTEVHWAQPVALADAARLRGVRAFTIDSAVYHEAGATVAQELALTTAAGLALLRELEQAGWSPAEAAASIEFRWVVTDEQFPAIAKLRAARVLWARILELADVTDIGQRQHASTSVLMLTARDPWVNLIRNCVAAFAGGVGGAESVAVQPHTLARGEVDDFAQRMARNTQHLLLEESHVDAVADAAGGSYYVEELTRNSADAAWQLLQQLEANGGIAAALAAGTIAELLHETWQVRSHRIAQRTEPVTGVSEFPDRERVEQPLQSWLRPGGGLPQHRSAEQFEQLRARADAAGDPTVTLLAIGSLARYGAREAFAGNLFAAGGLGSETTALSDGLPESVTPVVCLVGADADYADAVAEAVTAARAAGAQRIWLAGKPGDREESDRSAGVDGYLHVGCDAIAVLETTLTDLGVS